MIEMNSKKKTEFTAYQNILEKPEAPILNTLKTLFASESRLYTKLWNYRWNMSEDHLYALKAIFDSHIEELADIHDNIALRISQLATPTSGSMSEFVKQGKVRRALCSYPNAQAMVMDLKREHESIHQTLCLGIEGIVSGSKNQANINFLNEVVQTHEKLAWTFGKYLQN